MPSNRNLASNQQYRRSKGKEGRPDSNLLSGKERKKDRLHTGLWKPWAHMQQHTIEEPEWLLHTSGQYQYHK
eukprot:3988077-Prorocentrum_lima.AAC.1